MHPQCMSFFSTTLDSVFQRDLVPTPPRVVEFGSLNINGSLRELFPDQSMYWGVDVQEGPGVDEVADAITWTGMPQTFAQPFDLVLCAEVLEHQYDWRLLIENAAHHVTADGYVILTAAGEGRHPHSAKHGWHLEPGQWDGLPHMITDDIEYYGNIERDDLQACLDGCGFGAYMIHNVGEDIQAWATKKGESI